MFTIVRRLNFRNKFHTSRQTLLACRVYTPEEQYEIAYKENKSILDSHNKYISNLQQIIANYEKQLCISNTLIWKYHKNLPLTIKDQELRDSALAFHSQHRKDDLTAEIKDNEQKKNNKKNKLETMKEKQVEFDQELKKLSTTVERENSHLIEERKHILEQLNLLKNKLTDPETYTNLFIIFTIFIYFDFSIIIIGDILSI